MLLSSAECRRAVITSRRLKVAPPHLVRALLLVATTSTAVFAQGVTGTLSGTVKDPQGAVDVGLHGLRTVRDLCRSLRHNACVGGR